MNDYSQLPRTITSVHILINIWQDLICQISALLSFWMEMQHFSGPEKNGNIKFHDFSAPTGILITAHFTHTVTDHQTNAEYDYVCDAIIRYYQIFVQKYNSLPVTLYYLFKHF